MSYTFPATRGWKPREMMQVLPGHPLADQDYTIRGSELHVRQILLVVCCEMRERDERERVYTFPATQG